MDAQKRRPVDSGRYGADDSIEGAERARTREARNYRTLIKSTSTPCDSQSPDQTHCAADKCDVIIGSETYCSQCENTYVPIDRACNTIDNANGKCTPKNDGSCSACLEPYYLYSGGCYTACPDGIYAGSSAHKCTACDGTCKACSGAGTDKCTSCNTAENYLKLTDSSAGTGECVAKGACGTAHFEVGADKKCYPCGDSAHGGVADCTTCTPKEDDPAKAKCTACGNSKVPNADGSACVNAPTPFACPIDGCKMCSADKTACEECNTDKYLTPTSQCISNCAVLSGYYGTTENEKKVCKRCGVANCVVCGEDGTCDLCTDGFYGETCSKCDASCRACSGPPMRTVRRALAGRRSSTKMISARARAEKAAWSLPSAVPVIVRPVF